MENKPNGCRVSDPCTFLVFTCVIIVHCQTRFDLLFSIIMNCVTYSVLYENLTCLIATPLNSPGKTWKMDINGPGNCTLKGPGKSWKTIFSVLYAPCIPSLLIHPSIHLFISGSLVHIRNTRNTENKNTKHEKNRKKYPVLPIT